MLLKLLCKAHYWIIRKHWYWSLANSGEKKLGLWFYGASFVISGTFCNQLYFQHYYYKDFWPPRMTKKLPRDITATANLEFILRRIKKTSQVLTAARWTEFLTRKKSKLEMGKQLRDSNSLIKAINNIEGEILQPISRKFVNTLQQIRNTTSKKIQSTPLHIEERWGKNWKNLSKNASH